MHTPPFLQNWDHPFWFLQRHFRIQQSTLPQHLPDSFQLTNPPFNYIILYHNYRYVMADSKFLNFFDCLPSCVKSKPFNSSHKSCFSHFSPSFLSLHHIDEVRGCLVLNNKGRLHLPGISFFECFQLAVLVCVGWDIRPLPWFRCPSPYFAFLPSWLSYCPQTVHLPYHGHAHSCDQTARLYHILGRVPGLCWHNPQIEDTCDHTSSTLPCRLHSHIQSRVQMVSFLGAFW